jgi:hypothetical protein
MHAERKRKYGDVNLGAFKPRGVCSVDNCDNPHYGKTYCVRHYKRWRKYGDPESGGIRRGEAKDFLDSCLESNTNECLIFPYYRNSSGYGWVNISGKPIGAHVYIAQRAIGEKPTKKHEACHSCGNGHLGCVNPKHIYWGTRTQNVIDAINHGTLFVPPPRFGSDNHNFKCDDKMKEHIISMLRSGKTQKYVSEFFNISQSTVSRIKLSHQSS